MVSKPTAVMPLSISRNDASCDSARRRVTSAKKPISTTARPTGIACAAGEPARARTSGRDTAKASSVSPAAASSDAVTLTRGLVSRGAWPLASASARARARRSRQRERHDAQREDSGGDRAEARVMTVDGEDAPRSRQGQSLHA